MSTADDLREQVAKDYGVPVENVTISNAQALDEKLTILVNNNVRMSPRKLAAQAVHAALRHYGIDHGAVVVLGASPSQIREHCDVQIRDAGRTEVEPGTLTAGVKRGNEPR